MKLYEVQLDLSGGEGENVWDFPEAFNIVTVVAEDAISGARKHAFAQHPDLLKASLLAVSCIRSIDLIY